MDQSLCPLCGQSNRCTQADPRTADLPCWCFSQTIPATALQRVPVASLNKTCLCPRCAQAVDSPQAPTESRA